MEHFSPYVHEPLARRTTGKGKVAVYLGLALLLAAAALVAVNSAGSSAPGVVPQALGCAVTFTNPGPPALTACVSGHGNVNSLSYGPFTGARDHILVNQRSPSEGYCLRDLGTSATYYDLAVVEGGQDDQLRPKGWGAATQSSTATTTTVTRTTTDGIYTLTQNIFFKYGSRMVLIGNLLKNNDTVSHAVRFNRYADFNIGGSPTNDVFDTAGGSVFAQQTNGVALTSLGNPALVQAFGALDFDAFVTRPFTCGPHLYSPPPTAAGDYVAVMQHSTTIAPGATVNFRVGYRLL